VVHGSHGNNWGDAKSGTTSGMFHIPHSNSQKERHHILQRVRLFSAVDERLSLQARADFFNIFDHPNFGNPINYLTSPQFGQSTQMLGTSLGSGGQYGGLNPLYQIGRPSSVQLAVKLLF
jgi:hypothetical protein